MVKQGINQLFIGLLLMIVAGLLSYGIISLWPETDIISTEKAATEETVTTQTEMVPEENLFGIDFTINNDARLILLVMLIGGLGSTLHGITSFTKHVGKGDFKESWTWWYFLRPFSGMILAVIFYFVSRGGLLLIGTGDGEINMYGVAAVSGVVGLFAKQAVDKLSAWFKTIFNVADD